MSNRRGIDDDNDSRRGRDRDRDDDRGGRDRERGRDRDDDRGSSRRRDDDDSRDRRSSSSRGRDDDDRGSSKREGSSRYEYQARSADSVRQRAEKGANDFDKILKPGIKQFKPNDGDNRIRILPPTWAKADHYGKDIYVHYGVGPDRGTYLDLTKMLEKPDPINEERDRFKKSMDPEDKRDQAYLKELESKRRVLVYLVDRDNEREGVQAWAMPWTVDRDIVKVSVDKSNGEVLPIDHPEDGYDVTFEKHGSKERTEYVGVSIARRSTPLGKAAWLDFAVENPLPDQLEYFDYDHIAKAFGGAGAHKGGEREESRGRDRDDDRGGRDRDDRRSGRDDDRGSSRDRDDRRGRDDDKDERGGSGRERNEGKVELTWGSLHDMSMRELKDVIEDEKLDINPKEAKDDEDLADWVCEELKIKKPEAGGRRKVEAADDDRLREMRERRERD